jgi:rhamnosyl/mannosyltransferase
MNVLQLAKYYPPVYGGIELVEKMMTKAHIENQDKVFIVAFSNYEKIEKGEMGEIVFRQFENIKLLSAPFNFNFLFNFKKFIIDNSIDRIYVHLPNPFMHEVVELNKSFLKSRNIEVVAVYHSDIVNKGILGPIYEFYFTLHSSVYNKVIASSEKLWNSSRVLSSFGPKKKIIIPFCSDNNFNFKKVSEFKGKLLTIGRLVPYKGFEFLIKTFNNTEYELNIIGDGPLYQQLKSIASSNIIFHKEVSEDIKNDLFEQSDLLVVGSISRAEAYGMTIVESFARGMPVVATNLNSGVTYLVQNEVTGMTFELKNSEELIGKIDRLKKDKDLFSTISSSCRKFYEENLTFEKFKEKLINL